MSEWLQGATDEGGLLVPAWPADHGCDLILRSGQIEVHAGEEAGGALAWDELDAPQRPLDDARDRFRFDVWTAGRNYGTGIALRVEGRCRAATLEVIDARDTRRNRFNRTGDVGLKVPLAPLSRDSPGLKGEARLIESLCAVLAVDSAARDRLDERDRVLRLADDLRAWKGEVEDVGALPFGALTEA